jgi:hypothetical protein
MASLPARIKEGFLFLQFPINIAAHQAGANGSMGEMIYAVFFFA